MSKVQYAQFLIERLIRAQPIGERTDRALSRTLGIHHATVKSLREGAGNRVAGGTITALERAIAAHDSARHGQVFGQGSDVDADVRRYQVQAESLRDTVRAMAKVAAKDAKLTSALWALYSQAGLCEPDHEDAAARERFVQKLTLLLGLS